MISPIKMKKKASKTRKYCTKNIFDFLLDCTNWFKKKVRLNHHTIM